MRVAGEVALITGKLGQREGHPRHDVVLDTISKSVLTSEGFNRSVETAT